MVIEHGKFDPPSDMKLENVQLRDSMASSSPLPSEPDALDLGQTGPENQSPYKPMDPNISFDKSDVGKSDNVIELPKPVQQVNYLSPPIAINTRPQYSGDEDGTD